MLIEQVNDEQLLELCLELQHCRNFDLEGLSGGLITLYCMAQVGVGGTLLQVEEKIADLLASYLKESLVKKGYLEAEFGDKVTYNLTDKGKMLFKKETNG